MGALAAGQRFLAYFPYGYGNYSFCLAWKHAGIVKSTNNYWLPQTLPLEAANSFNSSM